MTCRSPDGSDKTKFLRHSNWNLQKEKIFVLNFVYLKSQEYFVPRQILTLQAFQPNQLRQHDITATFLFRKMSVLLI
jgi:hypothetical protein